MSPVSTPDMQAVFDNNDVQYSEKAVSEPHFYKSMNDCYLNFNRDACPQSSSQIMRLVIFRIFATPNPCEWRFCKQASQVQCGDNSSKHQFSTTNYDCHTPPACLLHTTVAKLYIYSAATRQSGYFTPCNNPASLDTAVARMVIQSRYLLINTLS